MLEKLRKLETRYQQLEELLQKKETTSDSNFFKECVKEHGELQPIIDRYREYKKLLEELKEAETLRQESKEPEFLKLANDEIKNLKEKITSLEEKLTLVLLPRDPNDEKNIFMEIRGGTGGEEAALFAGELFRMYARYAERKKWKIEMIDTNPTQLGGFKEVIFLISGKGVYSHLKFEGGTHRVQRVPKTEAGGRIHTSAATVAVLPEADEIDLKIEEKDLRIDTYRASGPGGQNVNKTSSAVRITHLPSGLVVACQEERSQHQNRAKALALLRARLLEAEISKQQKEITDARRLMVGTGDRSEKIRTYNFPQNRVTDHRIKFSSHNLTAIMDGDLDEMIEALQKADISAKIESIKR
jgi:peptide chain release factor 1